MAVTSSPAACELPAAGITTISCASQAMQPYSPVMRQNPRVVVWCESRAVRTPTMLPPTAVPVALYSVVI